jgi:type II secretory pathway pseudopilin PulG
MGYVVSQQRRRQFAFTLVELAIVALIISLLAGVLLQRLAYYQEEAARAGSELLLANMRSALHSKALSAAMRGSVAELAELDGANPINFLERLPDNYDGEIDGLAAKEVPPGRWYFDRGQRKLVYVSRGKKSFLGDSIERQYFRVEFIRLPTKNAKPHGAPDQDGSVALIQVDAR